MSGAKEREQKVEEQEDEMYSDPDEGVEIIDMENVRTMDWMAPESLRKGKKTAKKKKMKAEEIEKKGEGLCSLHRMPTHLNVACRSGQGGRDDRTWH